MDDRIICITGNEPIPTFFKEEIKAPRVVLIGGPTCSRMMASRMGELILAEMTARDIDYDWLGETPACVEDGFPNLNPDCETDHGERTNYKLKDQPFYMRGAKGKMRRY